MTVVWSADEGTIVEAQDSSRRDAAIRDLLREIQEEPASPEVMRERRRARLRWSELEPGRSQAD